MKIESTDAQRRYMAARDPQLIPNNPGSVTTIGSTRFAPNEEIYWVKERVINHHGKEIKTRIRVQYMGKSTVNDITEARVMKLDGSRDIIRVNYDDLEK